MGWHSPFFVIHWLVPLAPTMLDFHLSKLLSIFEEAEIFIHNLVCIALRQLLRVADIRLDDIEFDNGLVPSFWCQPVIACEALLVDLDHVGYFLLDIGLGFWGEFLSSIPEPDGLIERRLS